MCGISGIINYSKYNANAVIEALKHRGPNEQKIFEYKNVKLLHTRLSIQDISHGQQPYEFNQYVIVFNGEIYNHLSLRKKYLFDFTFKTLADTETLLYLYIKYGKDMFEHVDGMFSFAVLNKDTNSIFLARDRSGKKPLFIYKDKDSLMFASELNAIKAGIGSLKINEDNIYAYIRSGFFYKETTAYQDVEELEACSFYTIDLDSLEIKKEKYFNILKCYENKSDMSFSEALEQTDILLRKSVKNRLLSSDLEVGAFLSGGIDSSLVVAIASEFKSNLKTFTVKFEGAYDESHLAKITARQYNTNHHEISLSMNLKNDIEKILLNYGQPFMDSSAIPSYYVSQEAKKHVTVILNGDGADELFGGYRRYVPAANGLLKIASYLSFLTKVMPKPHNKKSLYNHIHRLLSMSTKSGLDYYLSSTTDIFEDEYTFKNNSILNDMNDFINKTNLDDFSKMLYLDFNMLLFSDLLVKMDIATMSASLEGRSPFLSKYLIELAPTLKNSYKIKGKSTKHILRELSKKYLSEEIIHQPKRGFEVPLLKWVNNDLKDNIFDSLSNKSYSQEFISKKFIDQLLYKKINVSEEKRAKMLWNLYCLEVWKKNQY